MLWATCWPTGHTFKDKISAQAHSPRAPGITKMCWLLQSARLPIVMVGVLTNNHHLDVLKSTAVEGPARHGWPFGATSARCSSLIGMLAVPSRKLCDQVAERHPAVLARERLLPKEIGAQPHRWSQGDAHGWKTSCLNISGLGGKIFCLAHSACRYFCRCLK